MDEYLAEIASSLHNLEKCLTKTLGGEATPKHETLLDSQGVTAVLIPCTQYPFSFYILALAYSRDLPETDDWECVKTIETFEKRDQAILRAAEFHKEHKKTITKNSFPF